MSTTENNLLVQPVPVPASLEDLVEILSNEMGPDGLENVNVSRIEAIMAGYKSNASDWEKFALFDSGRYTRNLVSAGNGKFNLMVTYF